MCVHTKTNLAAVGSWFPGLVHSALAWLWRLLLWLLATGRAAGGWTQFFRCVSGFEPTTIGALMKVVIQ